MNKMFLTLFLSLITGWTLLYPTTAPLNFGLSYNGYYSDNIFMNASKIKDYISQLQTGLNVSLKQFNFYLEASADIYADNPGFNSLYIEPGIEFTYLLQGRNSLHLGLSYIFLHYKDLYTDFNYSGPLFQASIKLYTSPKTLLKAGARFQSRNYTNFESFDFLNNNAFLEFKCFFKSQTTLRLQTGFNYRYYPHILDSFDFGENYNYYQNRASYGKNKGKSPNHPQPTYTYHTMSVPNIYGLIGIDQGFSARLGISGEIEIRENFQGLEPNRANLLIKNAYILYPLNDDYLWEGFRTSLQFKIVLFKQLNISLEGMASYFNKNYPGIYITDQEGNPIEPITERKDSLLLYMLKASKKIGKLELFTHFSYRHNDSNDDYFFYRMLTMSAGIGYYF